MKLGSLRLLISQKNFKIFNSAVRFLRILFQTVINTHSPDFLKLLLILQKVQLKCNKHSKIHFLARKQGKISLWFRERKKMTCFWSVCCLLIVCRRDPCIYLFCKHMKFKKSPFNETTITWTVLLANTRFSWRQ